MAELKKVAAMDQLQDGKPFCAEIDGLKIAVFKNGDDIYATNGKCTHMGGPLCQGKYENGIVTCPWHGSQFDVATGKVEGGPADKPVETYPVKITDGVVFIEVS